AGLVLGFVAGGVGDVLDGYSHGFPSSGQDYHLALWHGLEPALGVSAATLLLGFVVFWWRERVAVVQQKVPPLVNAADGYWKVMRFIDRSAARVTATTQRGS